MSTNKYQARPRAAPRAPDMTGPCACPFDGGTLETDGFCRTGMGYPLGLDYRPFVMGRRTDPARGEIAMDTPHLCPICKDTNPRLGWWMDWGGWCTRCHGSHTPHDQLTWTAPGDEYQYQVGGHWVRVTRGPRPNMPDAEFRGVVAGVMRAIQATARPDAPGDADECLPT